MKSREANHPANISLSIISGNPISSFRTLRCCYCVFIVNEWNTWSWQIHKSVSCVFAALSCRVSWLPGEAVRRFRQHAFPWEILQLEAVHWWWVQDRTVNPFGQKHPYILLRGKQFLMYVTVGFTHQESGILEVASLLKSRQNGRVVRRAARTLCCAHSLLLDLLLVRPVFEIFTFFGRASWHISCQKPPRGKGSFFGSLLDQHRARSAASAIVFNHSYWQEFRSAGLLSFSSPHFSPWCLQIMENIHLTENTRESDKSSKHVNTTFIFFERWKSWSWTSFITGVCFVQSITSWLAALLGPGAAIYKQQITCVSVIVVGRLSRLCWCQCYSDVRLWVLDLSTADFHSTWLLLSTSVVEIPEPAAGLGDSTGVCWSACVVYHSSLR